MQDLDFDGQLARTLKISGLLLAFLCLVLMLRPQDPVVWGFLVGIATGMGSAFFMARRFRIAGQMDLDKARVQIFAGIIARLLLIIAVLFIVAQIEWINILATAAGLFIVHGIFILIYILHRGASGEGSFKYK